MFISVDMGFHVARKATVLFADIDISKICFAADDRAGVAWCYTANMDEVIELRGPVTFKIPDEARRN